MIAIGREIGTLKQRAWLKQRVEFGEAARFCRRDAAVEMFPLKSMRVIKTRSGSDF